MKFGQLCFLQVFKLVYFDIFWSLVSYAGTAYVCTCVCVCEMNLSHDVR